MKKGFFAIILSVSLSIPTFADFTGHGAGDYGGTANCTQLNDYYTSQGGEYTIYDTASTNLLLTNNAYASTTSNRGGYAGSFETFCLEVDEYAASPVQIWVSKAFLDGSPGSHAWGGGTNATNWWGQHSGDDLDSKTAWLYTQFATGNLNGYAYDNFNPSEGLTRSQSAAALQYLIWTTEGESGYYVNNLYSSLNPTQKSLITSWNSLYSNSGWTGIGNVRILQNYSYYNNIYGVCGYCCDDKAQDFLYLMTPVPVPGAMLLGLLGMAAAGLKLRKFA